MILPAVLVAAMAAAQPTVAAPTAMPVPSLSDASQALEAGRLEQARLMVTRAMAGGAKGPELDRLLADLAFATGKDSEALARYDQLAQSGVDKVRVAERAGIAALSRIVLPLRIGVPAHAADVCTDVESLRKAVRAAAKKERNTFYLNHIGGLLLHGAGAAILWNTDGAKVALLNVALGYPVGLLSNYLAPRNSWHLYRERNWTIGVVPTQTAWLVTVGGEL